MRFTLTSLVTLVIGIVVLAACEGNVFSLKVGDCYNGASLSGDDYKEFTDVEIVSCDDAHENEVYAVFELPDSSWKGDDYLFEQAESGCLARFEGFVGIEYERSVLNADIFYPTEDSWERVDDRSVTCSVSEGSNTKVLGSAKGSRR